MCKALAAEAEVERGWRRRGLSHDDVAARIQELVGAALPPEAGVIVVGRGAASRIKLTGRQVRPLRWSEETRPEQLFAQGASGKKEAPWIRKGSVYEFRLYQGKERARLLDWVQVAQSDVVVSDPVSAKQPSQSAFISATPNPVPLGDSGATRIAWSTGDSSPGQVYLAAYPLRAYYPQDSATVIAKLEEARVQGSAYLVLPGTAFWWLDHYSELREHLEQHCRVVAEQEDICRIYALGSATAKPAENQAGVSEPLVSVVIPCYNQGRFLGEAIESALAQDYPAFEVVVVDDGSTDDTSAVAARYPEVRCIRQENQGLAAARNVGLREVVGEYVVFLDADDRLLPRALRIGSECLALRPDWAFAYGHCTIISAHGDRLFTPKQVAISEGHYLRLLRQCYIWTPGTVIFRRSILQAIGGFDTSVSPTADYDVYLRLSREFPVGCHNEVVLEYRRHGTNMSSDTQLMLDSVLPVLDRHREIVKGEAKLQQAVDEGIRFYRVYYGDSLVRSVRDCVTLRTSQLDVLLAAAVSNGEREALIREWQGLIDWLSSTVHHVRRLAVAMNSVSMTKGLPR